MDNHKEQIEHLIILHGIMVRLTMATASMFNSDIEDMQNALIEAIDEDSFDYPDSNAGAELCRRVERLRSAVKTHNGNRGELVAVVGVHAYAMLPPFNATAQDPTLAALRVIITGQVTCLHNLAMFASSI